MSDMGEQHKKAKDDGRKAWQRVQADATPLARAKRNRHTGLADKPDAAPAKILKKAPAQKTVRDRGKLDLYDAPHSSPDNSVPKAAQNSIKSSASKTSPNAQIDQKARRRLGRGAIDIDGRLDLHGLTMQQAQSALEGFIARGIAQRHVWLLVITGKGVAGEGILRRSLPDWLALPQLARHVVEYAPASAAHGGSGAFYLRLRKARLQPKD